MLKPSLRARQQHQLLPNPPREPWSNSRAFGDSTRAEGSISHSQADLQTAYPALSTEIWRCFFIFSWIFIFSFSTERVATHLNELCSEAVVSPSLKCSKPTWMWDLRPWLSGERGTGLAAGPDDFNSLN